MEIPELYPDLCTFIGKSRFVKRIPGQATIAGVACVKLDRLEKKCCPSICKRFLDEPKITEIDFGKMGGD